MVSPKRGIDCVECLIVCYFCICLAEVMNSNLFCISTLTKVCRVGDAGHINSEYKN